MRDYVIINGVNSNTITGLAISKLPPITKPMIRTNIEEIDGRDGDLITELGYSAYDKELEIGLYHDFNINEIIKYFTGEGTIIFSNEPDKFYNFKIVNQIDYEKLLKFKTAVVTIHCQPFKYPVTETPIELTPTTKTGTGTEITINDTREAPLDITLKGNTYQDSTTGKSLTYIEDRAVITSQTTLQTITLQAGTYTYQATLKNNANISTFAVATSSGVVLKKGNVISGNSTGISSCTFTLTEQKSVLLAVGGSASGYNVDASKCMLEIGNEATTYEPYTGGIPAPNPSYPMTVQTVTGDNTVEVVGENILNIDDSNLKYINSGGSYVKKVGDDVSITSTPTNYNFGIYLLGKIKNFVGKTITFSLDENPNNKFNSCRFINCDSNGTNRVNLGEEMGSGNTSLTFTIPNQTYAQEYLAIRIYLGNGTPGETYLAKKPRVVYGDTPKSYEPYTGQSYPVNLGVENLFNINGTKTYNACSVSISDGELTQTNSGTYSRTNWTIDNLVIGQNYTLSFSYTNESGSSIEAMIRNSADDTPIANTTATTNTSGKDSLTFTATETTQKIRLYSNVSNTSNTSVVIFYNIQLEKGSKENSYTPYGTTPIEMCYIPNTDYEDSFIRNSGKNLANISITGQVPSISTGELVSSASGGTTDYTQIDKTKNYVLTFTFSTTNQAYVFYYDENNTFLGYEGANIGATTGYQLNSFSNWNNTKYIRVRIDNLSNASQIMLNEGNQTLPYEPYGSGEWYLKKEIGKITYDGTENWVASGTQITGSLKVYNQVSLPYNTEQYVSYALSNLFLQISYQEYYNASKTGIAPQRGGLNVCIKDTTMTKEQFTTFLGTNNLIMYYNQTTPSFTHITGSLATQLDDLLEANGYDGQTNIVQINDILPFEMDVSTTFLYPMEINNIGNIYAKPILTIEGTGNIGVILNGITILQIALGDTGEISIDVPNLEAFKPSDNSLLNRLVTGDYMKLLIQEGDNTLDFSGNVTKATLTNYTRYI